MEYTRVSNDPTYLKELQERLETNDPILMKRFETLENAIWDYWNNPERYCDLPPQNVGMGLLAIEQLDSLLFPKHPSGKTKLDRNNPVVLSFIDSAEAWMEENGRKLVNGEAVKA